MTRYRGSIHIDDVRDGKNGRDAVTLVVTPPTISVDTKADGTVDESCLTDAKATVKAYAGGKPLKLTITSVEKSAGIDAEVGYADNFRIVAGVKIKAIAADATGYAMASGSVTVGLSVEVDGAEQRLTAVIGVVTTLHKVTAEIAKDNVSVTQKVTELTRTVNGNQTATETALSTLNGAIAGKVSRTDYDADKRAQSLRETEIRQSVEDITLAVKNRGNILRGTGFRNERTLPELTGDAVWSDKPEDLYGSHGVIHVPMSTETTARYAGMGFLVPLKELVSGRKYTLSCAVLVKDPANLSKVYTDMYYLKNDKTRLGAVGDGAQWLPQDFAAGSWRRVQVTFTPDFTDKPEAQYIIMYTAVLNKGEAWFAEPQLEAGAVATPWAPNVNDADENLQDTALEIKNRKIVATADNFVFRNNNGEETAAITEDGKLNTNVVDAKKIVAEGVRAQTIDAGNATFQNMTVMGNSKFVGTITTEDGSIAGWKLGRGYIGNGSVGKGLYISNDLILFNGDNRKRQAMLAGGNTAGIFYGATIMAYLKDETDGASRRMGLVIDIKPSANTLKKNIAINTLSGSFSGFRRTLRVTSDDITLEKTDSAILVTGNSTVHLTLPAVSEDGEEFVIYTGGSSTIVFETTDGASVNKIYQTNFGETRHIYHAVFAREQNAWYIFLS